MKIMIVFHSRLARTGGPSRAENERLNYLFDDIL